MSRITTKKWLSRKDHYKNKLKYELIYNGNIFDLIAWRKHLRKTKTLLYRREVNKNSFVVNPLGVKTDKMPF